MKLSLLPTITMAAIGMLLGLGTTTFHYAEGFSYLSKDPKACVNCHIMRPQYDGWLKASHHTVATCADCHLPASFPATYVAKSENGWNHSKAFTLQNFPEPIVITEKNSDILHENCLRCHANIVNEMSIVSAEGSPSCVHCHVTVGHGEQVGLGGPMAFTEKGEKGTK